MPRDLTKFILLSLLTMGLLTMAPLPSLTHAQDDWGVRRDPFDKGLIARYKRLLSKKPSDASALSKLMSMYRRYRSVGQLIGEYQAAEGKRPSFANQVVLGYLFHHQTKPEQAWNAFSKAAAQKPKDARVQNMLGKLARTAGNADDADTHFRIALANSSNKTTKLLTLRALAELAQDASRIEDLTLFFQQSIALDPRNIQLQLELGDALSHFQRYDEAIAVFRKAEGRLRSDPMQRVDVVSRIGLALEGKGDDLAAVAQYQRGMKLAGRATYLVKELIARTIQVHRRRQELPALVQILEKRWQSKRRGHFEWDTLARLYEESGRSDKAMAAYRKATQKAPYELDTQRRLIVLLENSGLEAAALKRYEAVIRVAPGEPRFQLELATRYWKLGETKKALKIAKKIESRFSGDAGVVASLADLYSGWDEFEKALASYQKLTRIEPGEIRHLENLGEQYHQKGDKKKAQQIWKKIVRTPNAKSYARLARVYAEHDLLAEGLTMYDKAIALNPKGAALFKGRANVHERLRRLDTAITDWETVLRLTPDKKSNQLARREARRRVVGLLLRPNRAGRARLRTRLHQWKDGFAKSPPRISAGYYLVEVYSRMGQLAKARDVLITLGNLRPSDSYLREKLVEVYIGFNQPELAIAQLLLLAQNSPGREADYYNQIAEIKTNLQQDGEAIEFARRALEKSPNDPVAYLRLAQRYQAMQKQDEAVSAYERSIELAPRTFKTYFTLARLYINRGQRRSAALLYRTVLENASNPEHLYKAGQEAVELEWLGGTLGELERRLAPLVAGLIRQDVYRSILVRLYGRYVPDLAAQLMAPSLADRSAAKKELERLGSHGLKPLLAALADEDDIQQQQLAVAVLGYLGNHGAAAPLVRLAQKTSESAPKSVIPTLTTKVRVEALVAAGRLGDPRTIANLAKLSKHKQFTMREAAVFALGNTKDRKALPFLLAATKDSQNSVQTVACLAMANIDGDEVIQKAISIVGDESKHDHPRAACAWLLGYRKASKAQPSLIQALSHGNDHTQRLSAWALGRLGDKTALPVLLSAYYTKREPIRSAAVVAIEHVLSPASEPMLWRSSPQDAQYPMTSQHFDDTRAIRALGLQTEVPRFPVALLQGQELALSDALGSAISEYRDLILRVLTELDSRQQSLALGALTASIEQLTATQQEQLQTTLTAVGRALLPQLAELTQHRDPEVRKLSLNVLAKVGGEQASTLLTSALADNNKRVRQAAMHSAARLARLHVGQGASLIEAVAKRLQAKHWQERVAAASALGQWPKHGKEKELQRALASDPRGFVRSAAAQALATGQSRAPEVYDALARAGSYSHERMEPVRIAAVKALQLLSGTLAGPPLARIAATDPSPRVRQLARNPK